MPSSAGDVVLVFGGERQGRPGGGPDRHRAGARVFGVERTPEPYRGHATGDGAHDRRASEGDIAERVRDATGGHGADIVYNTVGSPYFEAANQRDGDRAARQIFISTIERTVPFDIFAFYRGQHRFIGVDTLPLDSADGAAIAG